MEPIKLTPEHANYGASTVIPTRQNVGESQYDTHISPDNEDMLNEQRAQRQSLLDKVGNGLGNFASTVLTSAAENTVGMGVGIAQALFEQDPSKLYNNEFATQVLEPIQNWTKENMPFYYSEKEQDASVLGGMGYQNFWFDKALGGVGYTVGALASGYGLNRLLGVGKMAATGKLIENSADDVLKLASIESKTKSAIQLDVAKQIYVGMSMAYGESSQEARDSHKQALQSGMTESEAEAVANKNFVTNLFITGATNFALLNKFIKPSYQQAVERNLVHSVEKKGEDGIVKSFLEDATLKDTNRYVKGRVAKGLTSAAEESSQELGQFMSNKLWQRYEDLANDENGKSSVDNFLTAFGDAAIETFGSKEGLESALIGAITGAPFGMKGAKAEMLKLEENTSKYVNAMNEDPEFKNLVYRDAQSNIDTKLKLGDVVRAKAFFDQSEKSLLEGDKFEYHNNQLNGLGQVVKIVADKGTFDVWRKSLLDLKSSDDIQAFNQRFGFSETEVKDVNDKNEKIDKILESVDDMYSLYNVTKEFFNMNKYDGISDPLLNNIVNQSLFNKLYFSSINLNNTERREKEVAKELDALGPIAQNLNFLRSAENYNKDRDAENIAQLLADINPNLDKKEVKTYEQYRQELKDAYRKTYNQELEKLQKENPHIAPLITEKLADLNKLADRRELFIKAYNQLLTKEGREAEVQALNNASEIAKKQTAANQEKATREFEEEFGAVSPVDRSKGPVSLDNLSEDEANEVIELEKEWQTTTSATRLTEIVNRFKELGIPVISNEELQNSQNKVNAYLDKKRQEALDNNADVKDKNKFIGALNFKGIQPLLDDNDKVLLNNAINLLGNDFTKKVYLRINKAKHGTPGRKTPLGDNPLLQNNYNTVDVEVWVEGFDKPIGFIASYDRYATKEGDVIDVSLLTNEQIDQLFTLPKNETHDNFRAAYTDNKNFIYYVSKLLADNGDKEVTINNLDLNKIVPRIGFTQGIFNPIPLTQDRTPLSEFQDRLLQVNGRPVIIDRYGKSINEDGTVSKLTESNVLSFGDIILDDNLDIRPEFKQMMKHLSELNKKGELVNRYITLIANPAGPIIVNGQKYDVLPLSPQQLVEEDVNKLFGALEETLAVVNAALAENKNIDLQELDRLNESINKNIFIANTENSNVTIQVTPSGLYKLKFAMSSKKTIIDIYVDPKDEMFLETFDDLISAFDRAFAEEAKTNTALKTLFKPLTVKSFKQVLPDKPNAIDPLNIINQLETPYAAVYKQKQTAVLNFNAPKTVAPKVMPTQTVSDAATDAVNDAVTNIEIEKDQRLNELFESVGLTYTQNNLDTIAERSDKKAIDFIEQYDTIVAEYDAKLAALSTTDAKTDIERRREEDKKSPVRQSVKYKLQNKIGGIDNPTQGNEIPTLSEALKIAGSKISTPIKIKEGEITHIVFDQEESTFRFTYKGTKFAAFYIANARGNVRWEIAKFNDKTGTYQSISLDELKNINEKYGSQKDLLLSLGAKDLVEDIENFEKVEYSKEDKSSGNGIIPLENTVSAEQVRLGKKYGVTYTLEDFLKQYDAELAALENKPTTPSSGGFGVVATNVANLGNINTEDNSPNASAVSPIDEELAEFGNGKKVTETTQDDDLPAASLKSPNQVKDTIGWVEYSKAYNNLRAILGDTIGIEHMDKLATEIFDKNYLWGAFKDKTIYLNTSTVQGTEYHEAFHAVFRTFLNNYEIDNYLKVGKELLRNDLKKSGISFEQHFTVFKNNPLNAELVKKLNDAELKDLVVEEFMADEFMKWKNKRENKSFLSKLFQSIADIFKLLTGRYESELENFFYLIEGGKYVNHTVTKNKYYRDSIQAKLIPKDKRGGVTDPKRQMQMVNSIASKMLKILYDDTRNDTTESVIWAEVFDDTLAEEANQYNPDNYENLSPQDKLFLAKEYFAHDGYGENEIGRAIIKEEVFKLLRAYNIDENAQVADLIEKEEASRTFSDLNNENRVASFGGLTNEIKKYIALTTYKVSLKEYFKNPNLPDTEIEVAVDPKKIYDGIIKNASDSLSDDEIIRSMIGFMGTSEECKIFITKFFDDIGIDVDEDGNYNFILEVDENGNSKFKKPNLKQQVLKAFNLFTLDHRFVGYDIKNQQVLVQSANTQGVDTNQVNQWNRNFNDKFTNLDTSKKDIINTYDKLVAGLNPKKFTNSELEARITLLQNQFNNVSISLSRGYIKFMILSHGQPELLNKGQQNYVNTYVDRMETSNEFAAESLNQIKRLIQANNNPFGNQEVSEDQKLERGEAIGRLKKFAKDNALHDEQVGVSNFKNAENNSVYAYQHGTFHVRQALELRRQSEKSLQNKINDTDKLANTPKNYQVKVKNLLDKFKLGNYLNNLTSFTEGVRSTLEIVRGEGMRVRTLASTTEGLKDIVQGAKEEGVTFGNFTTRDLLLYYYSMFTDRSSRTLKDGSKIAVSPVILNIMEASSTLDMVNLPVHDMYDANGLNDRFINVIYQEIQKEYNRIELFNNNELEPNIDEYTTGKNPRAKIFWKWGNLLKTNLTPTEYEQLETLQITPDELRDKITTAINIYFNQELEDHLQLLVDEGIISSSVKQGEDVKYKNELLDKRFAKQKIMGMKPLFNEQDSLKTNIGKAFFSNYVNVMSYNQLQMGDPALHGKNEIDWFKRARKLNAGGSSLHSTDFQQLDYAVIDDPKFTVYFDNGKLISEAEYDEANPNHSKDETKDKADAQAYGNEVLAEQLLRSLGRFTKPVEVIFNKLKAGQEITFEERIKLKDVNSMLNSYKLVGVDEYGQFLKMSVVFIFEKDVTYLDKNKERKPITKHLERYHLYQAMKGIHMILPKSGSKNVTFGISKQQVDGSYSVIKNTMDTNFFRLQMENPAGKQEIKDPSQGIGINDTEQDDATTVIIDGKETTMGKVKEAYQKSKSDKSRALYHFHESFLFNVKNGVSTPRFDVWLNAVQESIASTGGNYQLTQLIELLKEKAFNIPAHYAQFEQYYNSHFSNVLQHKTPGYKTTLVSDFGYQVIEYEGKVITDKTYKADPEKWEALIAKNPNMVRRLNHNVLGKDGRRYSEFMLPAHFAEFYNLKPGDEIPDEIAFMFGVRIPTQDKHSALALKLVDFLPAEQGSNAVFPEEIIVLTGSDFDIDAFYIHRPDHYVDDNGKIKLYGNTEDSEFSQYIRWHKDNNKLLKSLIKNLLKSAPKTNVNLKSLKKQVNEIKYNTLITEDAKNSLLSDVNTEIEFIENNLLNEALTILSMPTTEEAYTKFKADNVDLNIGKLNNDILDQKIAFQNNTYVAENIANTPTSLDLIDDELDNLARLKGFEDRKALDKSYDIFGFNGLSQAHASVSGGQMAIGSGVNYTQIYTFLNKYGIEILNSEGNPMPLIKLNNEELYSYNKQLTEDNMRIMNVLSTLVSAMTDNGKHGYTDKGNINVSTLSVLCNIVMMGGNFRSGLYFINSPIVKKYAKLTKGNKIQTAREKRIGSSQIYKTLITELKSKISNSTYKPGDNYSVPLTDENLEFLIVNENNYGELSEEDKYKYDTLQLNVLIGYSSILDFNNKNLQPISNILKLNKGLGTTHIEQDTVLEDLGKLKIKLVKSEKGNFKVIHRGKPSSLDIKKALEKHLITSVNLIHTIKVLENAKEVQLSRSDYFVNTWNAVKLNIKSFLTNRTYTYNKIEKDLMSYLVIKAWRKNLADDNIVYDPMKLLYSPILKNAYDEFMKDAEFNTNSFINIIKMMPVDENGFFEIRANSFSNENKDFEERLINGYAALYNNPKYKEFATNVYLYVGAKDAFQFKSGTFINYISPPLFKRLGTVADKVRILLKNNTADNVIEDNYQAYIELFGSDPKKLQKDFLSLYLRDVNNAYDLNYYGNKVLINNDQSIKIKNDTIELDLFANTSFIHDNELITITQDTDIEEQLELNEKAKEDAGKQFAANYAALAKFDFKEVYSKGKPLFLFPLVFTKTDFDEDTDTESKIIYQLVSVNNNKNLKSTNVATKALYRKTFFIGNRSKQNVVAMSLEEAELKENPIEWQKKINTYEGNKNKVVGVMADDFQPEFTDELDDIPFEDIMMMNPNTGIVKTNMNLNDALTLPNTGIEYTPENITSLKSNEVFVFGSNTEGRHGKGAALIAKNNFGAIQGQSEGLQGQSYAIITKDLAKGEKSIPLKYGVRNTRSIEDGIERFLYFARQNPNTKFYVTKLGSSLAGYSIGEIKDLFKNSLNVVPDNVILPKEYEVRNEKSKEISQEISKENLDKKDEEKGKELTEKCKTGSSGGFGVSNINNIKDIID